MSTVGKDQEVNGNRSTCFPQISPMKRIFSSKTSEKTTSSRLRLDKKVAVITGAASGIGAATARLFVSHGAKVIIADVNAVAGKKLSSELGSSAHFFPCDVTDEDSVAAAVNYAVSSWGHLDIMFNNAGVSGPLVGLADVLMEDLDEVMAVHIKGAVLGVKHAARVMIPAGKGVILFSGSTSAVLGGAGPPLHSAANAAVLCIVRSAAAELVHHGIRVNAVSPHCVATPMSIAAFKKSVDSKTDISIEQFEKILAGTSELEVLTTDKVAHAVMFLASEEAGFISGHNLVLDGGFSVTKQFDSSNLKVALQKSLAAERKAEGRSPTRALGRSPTRALEASGNSKGSKASIEKDRVMEDKAKMEEEKLREKEDRVAQKALAQKDKEKQKEEKEREKSEEERKIDEEKGRANEMKAQAKERQVPVKDPKALAVKNRSHMNGELHPMDKKAREKEENATKKALAEKQIENEREEKERVKREKDGKIEEDKARAKQDKERTKEEKARAKEVKALAKEGQVPAGKYPAVKNELHLNGDLDPLDKKDLVEERRIQNENTELPNAGPELDIPIEFQSKPPVKSNSSFWRLGSNPSSKNPGQNSKKETKEDESTDPGKDSKKEKKEVKPPDLGKDLKKEAKAEKANSPKTAAAPEIASESQSKSSPLSRIGDLLRVHTTKKKDMPTGPSKVSQNEKKKDKPTDTVKTSKKESKAEKARTEAADSPKPASPDITSESQPKSSPLSRIGDILKGDSTKKKDATIDPGKISQKEKEDKPTDTGKTSKMEAKAEKARTEGKHTPKTAASPEITTEPLPKPSPLSRVGSLLSGDTTKKKESSADPGKVSQEGKREDKPTGIGKTSKTGSKTGKARTKRKDSPKTAASPEITSEPLQKPSLLSRIASLLRGDTTKKTDTGKISAKEAKSKDSK